MNRIEDRIKGVIGAGIIPVLVLGAMGYPDSISFPVFFSCVGVAALYEFL